MEHLDVSLGLDVKCHFLRSLLDQDRHITVKHINLLVGIVNHLSGSEHRTETDDDTAEEEQPADNRDELDLVFYIL